MKILSTNNLLYTKKANSTQESTAGSAYLFNGLSSQGAAKISTHENKNLSATQIPLNKPVSKIPLYALKSNFCPSFGKYKKAGEVILINKDTEKPVIASLRKEKTGDFVSYKIYTGREEAGFMDMDREALFPEGDFVLTEPDNFLPKVSHLRSILGDKYSGIGTALINAAVQESCKAGKNGCLWLNAEKGYARGYSDYRSDENPIPFYYKLGFKAVNPSVDELIKTCIENSNYNRLPDSALLLLSPEAINSKNKYFSQNYTRE